VRVLLLGMGSRGDVQPFVALGQRLATLGYDVGVAAAQDFGGLVTAHGLRHEPFSFGLEEGVRSEVGREWLGGSSTNQVREARLMKTVVAHVAPALADDLQRMVGRADAVVSSALSVDAASSLTAAAGITHAHVMLQPTWPSRHGPSSTFALRPQAVSLLNLGWSALAGRAAFDIVRSTGDLLRARLGLRRRSLPGFVAALRATPTVLAASPLVVPRAPDWPVSLRQTGFWFRDTEGADPTETDAGLATFLDDGPPPVYLGLGSMPTGRPDDVVDVFIRVLARLGRRGVVSAGVAGLGSGVTDRDLAHGGDGRVHVVAGPVAHEWLHPRCAAVVHHGGAGTTAAALRAGVPQVTVPHIADQPYWGRRVHELGVGAAPLPRKRFGPEALEAALEVALSPEVGRAASALGRRVRSEDGAGDAAAVLDALFRGRGRTA
jgi:sterol 3beta-glucosyltransferase